MTRVICVLPLPLPSFPWVILEQVTSLILIGCCHEEGLVRLGCESALTQSLFTQIPVNSSGNFPLCEDCKICHSCTCLKGGNSGVWSHAGFLESAIKTYLLVCHLDTSRPFPGWFQPQQALPSESVFLLAALPISFKLRASLGQEGKSTKLCVIIF